MNLKSIIISVLLILASTLLVNAQLIKYDPLLSQGYLVLSEKTQKGEDIASYQVLIYERVFSDSINYTDKVINKYRLAKTNYMKLEKDYYVPNGDNYYGIKVMAFNNNGQIISEFGPELPPQIPGYDMEYARTWKCQGRTYAYSITAMKHESNNMGYLSTGTAVRFYDNISEIAIPYYQYMGQLEYEVLIDNEDLLSVHYGLDYINMNPQQSNPNHIILHNVTQSQGIKDQNGIALTGTVHSIAKSSGYWRQHPPQSEAELELTGYNLFNIDWAINTINAYPSLVQPPPTSQPELSCNEISGGAEPSFEETDAGWSIHCLGENYDFGEGADFFEIMDFIFENCFESSGNNGIEYVVEIMNTLQIAHININPINRNTGTSRSLSVKDFYNTDGELVSPDFLLNAGLYQMNFVFEDNSSLPKIIDFKEDIQNYSEFSNELNVTVFPNPIPRKENTFSLHLVSTAKLYFNYTLWDTQGHLLYQEKMFIDKDKTADIKIVVKDLPSGTLINNFEFEDGSVLSVTSIKE